MSKFSFGTNRHDNAITSEQQEHPESSGKRRASRWDIQPKINGQGGESDNLSKRRKTRWSDDSQVKMSGAIDSDEVEELKEKLIQINKIILEVEVRVGTNSSSSPVYDAFGTKIDIGDANFHEKLIQVRQDIIARLIEKNPTFKPPENKLPKLSKKLYIPTRHYPSYNFFGLIIGPRGNTQKRMEQETGARIMLRGKGSRREGKERRNPDPSDDDNLHVLIEAENQKSLDDAVGMVEQLLIPVEEGMNEHKRAQLRELAILGGTLTDENLCNCGQVRHMKYACPSLDAVSHSNVSCSTCGGNTHSTMNCPLTVSTPCSDLSNEQKRSFLADAGGAGEFTFSTPQTSCNYPWQGGNTGFGISPAYSPNLHFGAGSVPAIDGMSSKVVDDVTFGRFTEAEMIKDQITGSGKGFGFVKYDSPSNAMTAAAHMNCFKIDGEASTVEVAKKPYFDFGAGSTGMPSKEDDHIKLVVRQLPPSMDDARFRALHMNGFKIDGEASTVEVAKKPYFDLAGSTGMPSKEDDHIKLVVRQLPPSMDDSRFRALFAPFGRLVEATTIKGVSGLSKCKGYVKYDNPSNAMTAVVHMNGYKIDGRQLTVKVAEMHRPFNRPQDNGSGESWPGPPGSMLSDPPFSTPKRHDFGLPESQHSSEQFPSSHRVPSLLQFPGNPDYHKYEHTSYLSPPPPPPPSTFSPQMQHRGSILPSPWPPIHPPRTGSFDFP